MALSSWDPKQYERFKAERSQPFFDLLALVRPQPGLRVVDLGCGTGEWTLELHRRLHARETLGLDRSDTMLAESKKYAAPGLSFRQGEISTFEPEAPFDLVFSNAALHWIPDHERLFTLMTGWLAPQGQLAVQVPANQDHPSQQVMRALVQEEPFAAALRTLPSYENLLSVERYAERLHALGFREQRVRLHVYPHLLAGREEVMEWMKGTALTGIRQLLSEPLYEEFLRRYREKLLPLLADTHPHFYSFKRILLWAAR